MTKLKIASLKGAKRRLGNEFSKIEEKVIKMVKISVIVPLTVESTILAPFIDPLPSTPDEPVVLLSLSEERSPIYSFRPINCFPKEELMAEVGKYGPIEEGFVDEMRKKLWTYRKILVRTNRTTTVIRTTITGHFSASHTTDNRQSGSVPNSQVESIFRWKNRSTNFPGKTRRTPVIALYLWRQIVAGNFNSVTR